MSTVIQILVKNSTKPVRFCWPLTFGPIDRCAAIRAARPLDYSTWIGYSSHFKLKAALCYAGLQTIVTSSYKKLSAILKLLTTWFSALLDECSSLIDVVCLIKYLKRWCSSAVTKISNIDLFQSIFKVFVAVEKPTGGKKGDLTPLAS